MKKNDSQARTENGNLCEKSKIIAILGLRKSVSWEPWGNPGANVGLENLSCLGSSDGFCASAEDLLCISE